MNVKVDEKLMWTLYQKKWTAQCTSRRVKNEVYNRNGLKMKRFKNEFIINMRFIIEMVNIESGRDQIHILEIESAGL